MRSERNDPPCVLLMHNPMMQYPAFDLLLFRARLLLEEGHSEKALATLEAIQTEDEQQQREIGALAEFERDIIRERTNAGYQAQQWECYEPPFHSSSSL